MRADSFDSIDSIDSIDRTHLVMPDGNTRLRHVLAVGARVRDAFAGAADAAPTPTPTPTPTPAPTAGWELVHDLAKLNLDSNVDRREEEIKYEQQNLKKLQQMFEQGPANGQVIGDAWTRASLGLPTMVEIEKLPVAKAATWYASFGDTYPRLRMLQTCTVGSGEAPKFYCDIVKMWRYDKPATFNGRTVDRATFVKKATEKWLEAQGEMYKRKRETRVIASLAWIRWMGLELKFADHLFVSDKLEEAADAELREAWGISTATTTLQTRCRATSPSSSQSL